MGLLDLPEETLLQICDQLSVQGDIYSLIRTCVKFHRVFLTRLYKHNVDHYHGSALPWCVSEENFVGVRIFLEQGARVKYCTATLPTHWDFDEDNGGVLHMARSLKMAKVFLDQGVDVNEMSYVGKTPLHVAVEKGDLAMATFLLSRGADVNAHGHENRGPSYFHSTPLQCALEHENHEIRPAMIKLLINHGARLAILDYYVSYFPLSPGPDVGNADFILS